MSKLLFNYSLYSHPVIGNSRVWQRAGAAGWADPRCQTARPWWDFPRVGSELPRRPITWITNSSKGHANPSPVRHRMARPDPTAIRVKVGSCARSLASPARPYVGRSHLGTWAISYAALRRPLRLAQCTTPNGDEGPRRGTVPTLLQHCSRTTFYHLTLVHQPSLDYKRGGWHRKQYDQHDQHGSMMTTRS
jgi:hypothetical protein